MSRLVSLFLVAFIALGALTVATPAQADDFVTARLIWSQEDQRFVFFVKKNACVSLEVFLEGQLVASVEGTPTLCREPGGGSHPLITPSPTRTPTPVYTPTPTATPISPVAPVYQIESDQYGSLYQLKIWNPEKQPLIVYQDHRILFQYDPLAPAPTQTPTQTPPPTPTVNPRASWVPYLQSCLVSLPSYSVEYTLVPEWSQKRLQTAYYDGLSKHLQDGSSAVCRLHWSQKQEVILTSQSGVVTVDGVYYEPPRDSTLRIQVTHLEVYFRGGASADGFSLIVTDASEDYTPPQGSSAAPYLYSAKLSDGSIVIEMNGYGKDTLQVTFNQKYPTLGNVVRGESSQFVTVQLPARLPLGRTWWVSVEGSNSLPVNIPLPRPASLPTATPTWSLSYEPYQYGCVSEKGVPPTLQWVGHPYDNILWMRSTGDLKTVEVRCEVRWSRPQTIQLDSVEGIVAVDGRLYYPPRNNGWIILSVQTLEIKYLGTKADGFWLTVIPPPAAATATPSRTPTRTATPIRLYFPLLVRAGTIGW